MSFITPPPLFSLPTPSSSKEVPCCKLNSGNSIPVVAYGTFRSAPGEVGQAVLQAIKAGYRHLDLAHVYGNEAEIGRALKQAFDEGLVTRNELFITGKLWQSDHEVEIVPKAADHSLGNLGIEYFDLYLIHFPVAWKHTGLATPSWGASQLGDTPLIDTWRAMEKLYDEGKAKAIGVSNYPLLTLHDLVTQARIMPAVNQIEVHPYYVRESLVNYCASRNILVMAHTPLGGGVLNKTEFGIAQAPMEDDVVKKIASETSTTPARVLLRWLLQRGIGVIPKSIKVHRMQENMDLFGFELSREQMEQISALDKYQTFKTNKNPLSAFLGGSDAFSKEGTDIFD